MFNHSPHPNVMFTRVAPPASEPEKYPKLVFRTIKPICKGDELYICYSADESKLWFSPDYKKEGDATIQKVDEPEWIAPMADDEDERDLAAVQDPMTAREFPDSSQASRTAVSPIAGSLEQVTNDTGDQKYHDRKARKQSKREKKVKKPKPEAEDEQEADGLVSDKQTNHPINHPINGNDPSTLDTSSSLSPSDYGAALAKLSLVRAITVDDGDIEQEKILDARPGTAEQQEKGSAWSLVKRIRGPVEAQENDGERTGKLGCFIRCQLHLNTAITVEIWALSISDKKLVPSVLK